MNFRIVQFMSVIYFVLNRMETLTSGHRVEITVYAPFQFNYRSPAPSTILEKPSISSDVLFDQNQIKAHTLISFKINHSNEL